MKSHFPVRFYVADSPPICHSRSAIAEVQAMGWQIQDIKGKISKEYCRLSTLPPVRTFEPINLRTFIHEPQNLLHITWYRFLPAGRIEIAATDFLSARKSLPLAAG